METGTKGKKERRQVGKLKEGKVGTESWPEGKEEGPNTFVARGPANFRRLSLFSISLGSSVPAGGVDGIKSV